MPNNATLDTQLLIAAQQAYNIDDTGAFTGTLTGTALENYVVEDTEIFSQADRVNLGTGFKVIMFKNTTTHEYIISFRGTDPTSPQDWYSNGQWGWNQWENDDPVKPKGQTVLDYISRVLINDPQATFRLTGHSLGGGLAQYAAYDAITKASLAPSQLTLTTFNAFGVLDNLAERRGTTTLAINASLGDLYAAHYIAQGDLVGLLAAGHVGETTGGTLNTYLLGTTTRFFLDAHDLGGNDVFNDLSLAQSHDFAGEYLRLKSTQGVLAAIAAFKANNGDVSDVGAVLRLVLGIESAVRFGHTAEIDRLGDWLVDNFHASGKISLASREVGIAINWGAVGRAGGVALVSYHATLVSAVSVAQDALTRLRSWAGAADYATYIDATSAELGVFSSEIQSYLPGNERSIDLAEAMLDWLEAGYNIAGVLQQAEATAALATTDPATLQAQAESDPLSLLPALTAPDPADYSDDATGQAAYQQAVDLYNQKLSERTQLQDLYNQYLTDTDALNLLPTLSARDPSEWQTVLTGDANGTPANDDITADPVTTHIYGYQGDDILSGRAGHDGSIPDIQLWGGEGHDTLHGEVFYVNQYYSLGQTDFETQYGRIKPGPGAFLYGESGNDRLLGSLQDDTLDGGLDHDYIDAHAGDDTVIGGPGNDLVNGHEGRDTLDGNEDNDLLAGGAGADHIKGGDGDDQLYGDARYHFLTWDGINGTLVYGDLGGSSGSFPVVQDVPEAQAGDDVLEGGAGNDELYGGAGDDLLDGGSENDKLQGEGGDDILFGGDGNDRLWSDSSADAITTDAQPIQGDYGTYTYYWRERHVGADGNDYLDGGAGNDQGWGGGGRDHLLSTVRLPRIGKPLFCKLAGYSSAAYRLAA
jgi:Ca2+-binding RTX toxin-like protein